MLIIIEYNTEDRNADGALISGMTEPSIVYIWLKSDAVRQ